jgi:hypothetical protein
MYSIIVSKGTNMYAYALDETTGEPFAGTLAETKVKFNELLQKYPISKLVVVHNTTVTAELSIVDVE